MIWNNIGPQKTGVCVASDFGVKIWLTDGGTVESTAEKHRNERLQEIESGKTTPVVEGKLE